MARPDPPAIPLAADERVTLVSFLDFYRAALLDRAWGLESEQLSEGHQPTTLTLARLLGHMSYVEKFWFRSRFSGADFDEPFASLDWDADVDAEMTLAESWSADELRARYSASIEESRAITAKAESLDVLSARTNADGEAWNLRWILVHMIEEYARHTGHADLIREAIDGDVVQ